jgi:hypothetical protein
MSKHKIGLGHGAITNHFKVTITYKEDAKQKKSMDDLLLFVTKVICLILL